jgi:hypothetical protein
MSTGPPAETGEPEPARVVEPSWDNLGCLAMYTLFGWGFIAACVHDWFFGTNRAGWVDLLPLPFCVYVNLSTTVLWVRYVKSRRLPHAERLNSCPFPVIRELTPEETALLEEQLR